MAADLQPSALLPIPQLEGFARLETATCNTVGSGDSAKNSQLGGKRLRVKCDLRVPAGAFQPILLGRREPLSYEAGPYETAIFAEY